MNVIPNQLTRIAQAAALVSGLTLAAYRVMCAPGMTKPETVPQITRSNRVQASSVLLRPQPSQPQPGLPEDTHLDKTPPRHTTGLDLVKLGWIYNCMECHKVLPARWHYDRPMVEHEWIKLDHGNNRFCLNCHHPTNRNAFVDYDGSEIAEADVVLLCAKCHGPTYRDWKAGAHGRRNGYWNPSKGVQTRLRCIECHDPHQPAFKPLQPLPAPGYPARAPRATTPGAPKAHVN